MKYDEVALRSLDWLVLVTLELVLFGHDIAASKLYPLDVDRAFKVLDRIWICLILIGRAPQAVRGAFLTIEIESPTRM